MSWDIYCFSTLFFEAEVLIGPGTWWHGFCLVNISLSCLPRARVTGAYSLSWLFMVWLSLDSWITWQALDWLNPPQLLLSLPHCDLSSFSFPYILTRVEPIFNTFCSLISHFICPSIRCHCLRSKVCTKGMSVFKTEGLKVCDSSTFKSDHILRCDLLFEQPCSWIIISLQVTVSLNSLPSAQNKNSCFYLNAKT